MITSRTPLRISFFGGGTDYPQWFREHGGAALGTSIDKYVYVSLHDGTSSHFFDLPTKSGLGSSSAYTVGLLRAVNTALPQKTLAKLATTWEFDKMNGNVGHQDQYLCAMGGFRLLRFSEYGIRDGALPDEIVNPLQDYLMLFDTHQYRRAGDVVAQQLAEMGQHEAELGSLVGMVAEAVSMMKQSDYPAFGRLLHEAWMVKRRLSPLVSTPTIDAIYESALKSGAIGGKLLGAGGGGFIIFVVPPDKRESVGAALEDLGQVDFCFENQGSVVLYHD